MIEEHERELDKQTVPWAWVQLQGTDFSLDVHCICGEMTWITGDFLYHIKCSKCGQVYEVGSFIRLYPIDHEPEDTEYTVYSSQAEEIA